MKSGTGLAAFVLIILVSGASGLYAQEPEPEREISVTAKTMTSLPDGTLRAEGAVNVNGEGVIIRADRLSYDPGSDTLILSGNVVMKEESGGSFTGDALVLDMDDLTGGISRGEIIIVPNGFRVRGEDISRLGPEEYSIRKGVFTSCPGDCPEWSFTASKIQVRKEGYLEARHAAFRILNVPVFYTPYLLYPVKTSRQTGLLFPELGFSEETGLETIWPVFITLGPSADATISPRTFSRDGFGLEFESRYRLDWGGGGKIEGFTISGDRSERWYLSAEHSMALSPDLWIRGRWYDAGDSSAAASFADDFEERYPGAVNRHLSLEGDHGFVGYDLRLSSLVTDGALARDDLPGTILEREIAAVHLDPGGGDLWRAGLSADVTRFENGESRDLLFPSLGLRLPGPWKLSGDVRAKGILSTGGRGTTEDGAWLMSLAEKLAVESTGGWGKHRVGLELTASAAQGAAFGESPLRDSKDLIEKRKLLDVRLQSLLTSSTFDWDLTAGAWRDSELNQSLVYGMTRFSLSGIYLEASRNQDADFGLVLPSIAVDEELYKGWQIEAGFESEAFSFSVGRDAAEGFPDMFKGRAYFRVAGVSVSGKVFYDMDADSVADEILNFQIPGRCWTAGIERSSNPDRTDWSLQLELGL
ncbi:MAG: hypothetical protein PVJ01_04875 [Pseudomonadota bacterium]